MENRGGSQILEPFKRDGFETNDKKKGKVTKN